MEIHHPRRTWLETKAVDVWFRACSRGAGADAGKDLIDVLRLHLTGDPLTSPTGLIALRRRGSTGARVIDLLGIFTHIGHRAAMTSG